jgi:ATP-dependent protease ClpP protease subunit
MTKGQLELLDIYYNQKDKCDHLWIDGDIDYTSNPEGRERLKNLGDRMEVYSKSDKIALIIHINSYGGDANASFFIYNLLESFPKPKIGVNEGVCMSAATFALLSCELRIAKPISFFLMHQTRSTGGNSTTTFKEKRRMIYSEQERNNLQYDFYQNRTKMSRDDVKKYLRAELEIKHKDAINYGIYHHIFDQKLVKKTKSGISIKIVFDKFVDALSLLLMTNDIKYKEEKVKEINIFFNNYQIETYDEMYKIVNMMVEISVTVNFYLAGVVNNISYFISLFADKRYLISPYSLINLIPETVVKKGHTSDGIFEDTEINIRNYREMMMTPFKTKTKLPKNILDDMMYKQFTFTPTQALKYKLVDKLVTVNTGVISPYHPTKHIASKSPKTIKQKPKKSKPKPIDPPTDPSD